MTPTTTTTRSSKAPDLPRRFGTLVRKAGRDPWATKATLALFRASARLEDAMDAALAGTGLSPPKFNVLMELSATPGGRLPLCQLADRLVRSAPNISGLIDRMEAQGLARRVRDEVDRRVVFAEITEEGWAALPAATASVFASEQKVFEELQDRERKALVGLLDAVARPVA